MSQRFRTCLLVAVCMLMGLSLSATAETRYVSSAGQHIAPFINWPDAATNIQAAIDISDTGDTVLVTNGTYVLDATVRVTNEVTLVSLNGRETVLLDGSFLSAGQDAVFLMFGTLDGFTVSNAPRHGVKSEYGEIYNSMITHSGQTGIDSWTAPRIVTNSTLIVTNTVVEHSGEHGIYTCAEHTWIYDCVITHSESAGVLLRQHDTYNPIIVPRVTNFLVQASVVSSNLLGIGLAVWMYNDAYPDIPIRIEDCLIEGNAGFLRGAGISDGWGTSSDGSSGVQITRSVIRGNTATLGGGVYFRSRRSPSISHSIIEDNVALSHGGGLYMMGGLMHNCVVRNNISATDGGGVWGGNLHNNTIVRNQGNRGGGTYNSTVRNSIVYYNQANINPNTHGGSVASSCITPWVSGAGNITDPPGIAGFRNWRLVADSACIDAGDFWFTEGDYDLDGGPRIWGEGVDMGCDEYYPPGLGGFLSVEVEASTDRAVMGASVSFQCDVDGQPEAYVWHFSDGYTVSNTPFVEKSFDTPGTHMATVTAWNPDHVASNSVTIQIFPGYTNYVSLSGSHEAPFTNWTTAASNIQDAINDNMPGGVVMVNDGIYDQGGRAVNGGLTNRIAVTNVMDVVSLNGSDHTYLVGSGPLGDDAVRCAYLTSGARLIGFTLTDGHTRTTGNVERDQSGGGVWTEPGGVVQDCVFRNNAAHEYGGGIINGAAHNSVFHNNTAYAGGGAYNAALSQCILSNNVAVSDGGGANGGSLTNVLLVGNQAAYGGGAAWASLTHATVVNNHATQSGGGVYRAVTLNSIMYFNTAGVSWPNYFNTVCLYSCTTPDPQATGSITNDPLFVDAPAGIYRLRRDSPAVDVALETDIEKDLMGAPRALPGSLGGEPLPDMGAYEFTSVHYVSPHGGHVWPFSVWEDAAHDLQSAIDAALPNNQVFVSSGVYNTGGRAHLGALTNRVVIDKPISVIAVNGYADTVIEGSGPVGDAAIRGVYLGADATLMGFTIRDGATRATGDGVNDQSGAGIWSEPSGTVSNCVIELNAANALGGGVYGGRIVNTFVHANTAAQGGGVAHADLDFCTVINNSATEGGGAYQGSGRFSILYFNLASSEGPNVLGGSWDTCCVTPDPGGPGHITDDPQLMALDNFRLLGGSPCIDVLTSSPPMQDNDLLGVPRPLDGNNSGEARFDIGAHEYIHPTADTDGDGLSDWDEIHVYGTDPTNPDTDGDGQSDHDEIIAGTDPLDPDSYFAVIHMSVENDEQIISWPGSTGRLYTILATDHMGAGLTNRPDYTDQPGVQGTMSFTNEHPARVNIFGVRVRLVP